MVAPVTSLTRQDALDLASKYVAEWTEQTKNSRGHVHDKWTPVEVTTRTECVLKVADWLLDPGRPVLVPPIPPNALADRVRDIPPA